jgi:2-keto-4-pentenoate hydratase
MINEAANALNQAEQSRVPIAPLSETYPSLTPEESYAIQGAWLKQKLAKGAHVTGSTYLAVYTTLGEVSISF